MEVKYDPNKAFADYINKDDCLIIDTPRDIADNLKEFIGFMRFALESGFDIWIKDGNIDTRTAGGRLMIEILWGIDRFDDKYFGGK